ncbi:MAG: ribonuclease H-like domain-containing protein [Bacillota bacterium]|nr:ribonuclease H-like domain-containing protein [Bacillota bacterium]
MKQDLKAKLSDLRRTGEIQTGRQYAEKPKSGFKDRLFPEEGHEEETAFGRCYMRELLYPLTYQHGWNRLSGIDSCCGTGLALSAHDDSLADFNPRESLFLDIETTGLSGGTGTWAFLIGLGWLEGNSFKLRQYFLRRPAEERAILSHFSTEAERFPAMITFNGKIFDLPLIQTRQILAGLRHTVPPRHLDLLQCARSLWKKRLPSRSLKALEEALLGIKRFDDIPGSEIPAVYFEYLRHGNTEKMRKVFHHNVLDILSMVTLLKRVSLLATGEMVEHPAEELALGRLCINAGRIKEGLSYLRRASVNGTPPLAEEAAIELALFYKRRCQWEKAVSIWQMAIDNKTANPTFHVELAKYFEHRQRDYSAALSLTEEAIGLLKKYPSASPGSSELSIPALEHRSGRLRRRLAGATRFS